MKLFFNPQTKSIVLYKDGRYFDMRNGNETVIKGRLPLLKPYTEYTLSKLEDINPPKFLSSINVDVIHINGKCQLGGNYPRYFWKGLMKLITD